MAVILKEVRDSTKDYWVTIINKDTDESSVQTGRIPIPDILNRVNDGTDILELTQVEWNVAVAGGTVTLLWDGSPDVPFQMMTGTGKSSWNSTNNAGTPTGSVNLQTSAAGVYYHINLKFRKKSGFGL